MEAWESKVSAEVNEKPELELDERELEREWVEMVDNGETDRGGEGNLSRTGVSHVGAATSSAIMAKSWSSSSSSSSNNCCARVLRSKRAGN